MPTTSPAKTKRIVILCDGTWNEPDAKNPTNVVKLANSLLPVDDHGVVQSIFYDQGVGTDGAIDSLLGGAIGLGVEKNVLDGYRYLIHNYSQGDDIYLFGFSRGAYTARAIAGLVGEEGVLQKERSGELKHIYRYYRTQPENRGNRDFNVGLDADIKMVGVFDTVGALGVPTHEGQKLSKKYVGFYNTKLSKYVRSAYHALAIDEKRSLFKPDLWVGTPAEGQEVEQCWFRGAHSDIGGGYPSEILSDISLNWMVTAAVKQGLAFNKTPASVTSVNVDPTDSLTTFYKALKLVGRGTLERLKELSYSASEPPINLTIHPTAINYMLKDPQRANLWSAVNGIGENHRSANRMKLTEVGGCRIRLVQNGKTIDAELSDVNHSMGVKAKIKSDAAVGNGDIDLYMPEGFPTYKTRVWAKGGSVGLH